MVQAVAVVGVATTLAPPVQLAATATATATATTTTRALRGVTRTNLAGAQLLMTLNDFVVTSLYPKF